MFGAPSDSFGDKTFKVAISYLQPKWATWW